MDKINSLWLDEINKNYVPPQVQSDAMMGNYTIYNANNVKTLCKNSKANITLTKEQIISYFTELHQKNTAFIQNYIDSINANHGIKAYHLNHKVYDDLFKKGIIYYESMLKWQNGTTEQRNQLKIIALDYLKKN